MTSPLRPRFSIRLVVGAAPDEVWRRLWDLDRHTAAVPLTTVAPDDGRPLGPGSRFVARTTLGPVHLDDVMVVREWEPGRAAVVEKVGTPLGGRITARLQATGPGTVLSWQQEYTVRGLPDVLAAVAAPLVRSGYARTLRRITGA